MPRRNTEADFWARVDKSAECWLWTGAVDESGYGRFSFGGKSYPAHRLAWILTHGEISRQVPPLLACHNCPGGDNRLCVRPGHLFLGTSSENIQDYFAKSDPRFTPHRLRDQHKERAERWSAGELRTALYYAFGTWS